MNEQITIKYKEETLIKSEMTEREKAIWDDGYNEGIMTKQKYSDGMIIIIAASVIFVVMIMVINYFINS